MKGTSVIYWLICVVIMVLLDAYSIMNPTQLLFVAILLTSIQLSCIVWGEEDII